MGTLRGHPQQPLEEATLALAPALAASPLFWGGVFKELPGAWTSRDDSGGTVALRQS